MSATWEPLDDDELPRVRAWASLGGMPWSGDLLRLLATLDVERRRREEAEAALGACAGWLSALRDDDSEYDFTLLQYEQIGRLCQLAWRALAHPESEVEDDEECLGPEGDCVNGHVPPCPLAEEQDDR